MKADHRLPPALKLQDAKAHFSQVVRQARELGPQRVTVHGKDAVVILSAEDYARLAPAAAQQRRNQACTPCSLARRCRLYGLPVPGIFLYRETDTGRHLVVDGQQRLRTLQFFYNGISEKESFGCSMSLFRWRGRAFAELQEADQRRLNDSVIHATTFKQEEPRANDQSMYLNVGSVGKVQQKPLRRMVMVCG